MSRIHKNSLWQITIPDAWSVSGSGENIMLFRPDGVGMLHVVTSDTVGRHDLLAYARDHPPPGTEFVEASCGSFRGFVGSRTENGTLWRTWWFLCRGQQLVYAGYECGAKNGQVESSEVEAIIQSFDNSGGNDD
jgi:hypothetical protein